MTAPPLRLVVLAAPGPSTDILVNALDAAGLAPLAVLMEPAQSRKALLRGRLRRLGWRAVLGQVLFLALAAPLLRRQGQARLAAILREAGLNADPLPDFRLTRIASVNAPETADRLRALAPQAVVLSGTRILKPATLAAAGCPVLNIHAGITPAYRGVHGGYWALWQGAPQDFGATLHLVDAGVDTGEVLAHCRTRPGPADNFATYPLLQLAAALGALTASLERISRGLPPQPAPGAGPATVGDGGRQWYHPTLGQYLAGRLRGIR
jgi:hypothetical protein